MSSIITLTRIQWDAGGRMYDIDQNGYQKLSKEARSRMTINGEAAAEIDIEACFSILWSA